MSAKCPRDRCVTVRVIVGLVPLEGHFQRCGDRILGAREQVSISVRSDPNRTVAEVVLHFLHVPPLSDQKSGAGMAKIMPSKVGGYGVANAARRKGLRSGCRHRWPMRTVRASLTAWAYTELRVTRIVAISTMTRV